MVKFKYENYNYWVCICLPFPFQFSRSYTDRRPLPHLPLLRIDFPILREKKLFSAESSVVFFFNFYIFLAFRILIKTCLVPSPQDSPPRNFFNFSTFFSFSNFDRKKTCLVQSHWDFPPRNFFSTWKPWPRLPPPRPAGSLAGHRRASKTWKI